MRFDKSSLQNTRKLMAFLQLLVLHLSDANMEIHKYRLVVLSHF